MYRWAILFLWQLLFLLQFNIIIQFLAQSCVEIHNYTRVIFILAGPSGRAVYGVGVLLLACCDRGFESHRGHGCLSVVSVVCCQVEVSATDWSLVQRSSTDCGASLCVIKKPRKNEEAKARYRAVENTTTVVCNARKTNIDAKSAHISGSKHSCFPVLSKYFRQKSGSQQSSFTELMWHRLPILILHSLPYLFSVQLFLKVHKAQVPAIFQE